MNCAMWHSHGGLRFFFSSRRRHTRLQGDWSSDVCSSDLITAGAGNLWVTENAKNKIARITTGGTVTEFTGASHGRPTGITFGPDGNLWYKIGRASCRGRV